VKLLLSFKTNPSGYLIKNNTDRNTFALEDNAASGMVLAVHKSMGEICPFFPTRKYYMKRFRITNISGYSSLEGLAVASSF
jgi:hypothetical protein